MTEIDTPEDYPKTVNLPSGGWIKLSDWRTLRRGSKRDVLEQIKPGGNSLTQGYDITSGLLKLLIVNWSFTEYPLPSVAADSLNLLPLGDDSALAAAVDPARRALFPPAASTPEQEKAQEADEASPTGGGAE